MNEKIRAASENKEKRNILETQTSSNAEIFIHLDGTQDGVDIPKGLLGSENVTLKLSHAFQGILRFKNDEIEAHLLFPEGKYDCHIPYEAIWGFTDEKGAGHIWSKSAPRSLLEDIAEAYFQSITLSPQKDSHQEHGGETPPSDEPPSPSGGGSHLKRIK